MRIYDGRKHGARIDMRTVWGNSCRISQAFSHWIEGDGDGESTAGDMGCDRKT